MRLLCTPTILRKNEAWLPMQALSVICLTLLLAGCGPQIREEVVSRHENGEKKLVVSYLGEGENERVVKRVYFYPSGSIEAVEEDSTRSIFLEDGTHLYEREGSTWNGYLELNSFWDQADSLLNKQDYRFAWLDGKWSDLAILGGDIGTVQFGQLDNSYPMGVSVERETCGRVVTSTRTEYGLMIISESKFEKDFTVGGDLYESQCKMVERTQPFRNYVGLLEDVDTLLVLPLHPDTLLIQAEGVTIDSLLINRPMPVFSSIGRYLIRQ